MRILLLATVGILLGTAPALAQDESGSAYQQLQNATSGHQTLEQTYGDSQKGEKCPEACPDAGDTNVPDASPPQPVDDSSNDDNN